MRTRSLQIVGGAMIVVGVALVLGDTRIVPGFTEAIARAMWDQPTFPDDVVAYNRFVHGVLGGVIAGWGAMVAVVARESAGLAFRALAIGMGVWYAIDTSASLSHGAWPNALLNTIVVVGLGAGGAWLWRAP